jgi:hypothetical protein
VILTSSPSHSVPDENHVRYRTIFMEPSQTISGGLFDVLTQEMRLRNYSPKTIKAYKSCIRSLARYYDPKHPRELTNEEIHAFLVHQIEII